MERIVNLNAQRKLRITYVKHYKNRHDHRLRTAQRGQVQPDQRVGGRKGRHRFHYDKGLFIVRLHTGDPCIYGAIQEQMAFFDEYGMDYHITPGISSFLAAAAALQSQFTIPEKVQTIILTRGEGRTPMPREP